MAQVSPNTPTVQFIVSRDALNALCQSFDELPNNLASLYLSTTSRELIIYVAPTRVVNTTSFAYLDQALRREEGGASALKHLLETDAAIKVFFDARKSAQILSTRCGIRLSIPPCIKRAHIHEVQMMELTLRRSDHDCVWLAGLDRCIVQDSSLRVDMLDSGCPGGKDEFDERILHLPVLWKKYHDRLLANRDGVGGSFWVAQIREATRKRLAVSCGETHKGYSVDGAQSAWDKDSIEEQTDAWNDDVMMDTFTAGEWLGGAEHWKNFDLL